MWIVQWSLNKIKILRCAVHCFKGKLSIYTTCLTPSISLDSPFKLIDMSLEIWDGGMGLLQFPYAVGTILFQR